MIYVVSLVSFILDFILNHIFYDTLFLPLFYIVCLVILERYFKDKKKYYIYCFGFGLFYDLFYFNTIFLNASLFSVVGIFIKYFNNNFSNNIITLCLSIILFIFMYRLLSFGFYFINRLVDLDLFLFLKSIYSSLILNVIYSFILYFVLKKFKFKSIK